MRGKGRRIVVDADVGRAAADVSRAERGEKLDPRSLRIADALSAFLDGRHLAVYSPSLLKEWRNHVNKGSAGHRWLVRMLERTSSSGAMSLIKDGFGN